MNIENDGEEDRQEPESFESFEARVAAEEGGDPPVEKEEPLELSEEDEEVDENGDPVEASEDSEEGEEEKSKKKPMSAKDRIIQLNARNRENERRWESERRGFEARLEALENNRLTPKEEDGKKEGEESPPDPTDKEKYPLGTLDDRYIEDSINYRVEKALERDRESSLQRQEQSEFEAAAEAMVKDLQTKADNVAEKGSALHADYEDVVVKAGLAGDYDLTQTTFEAAAEAEHGAEILYALATDTEEATRVANLSPFQQLQYVAGKNAEIAAGKPAPKKIPGASTPPANPSKGRASRKTISPATTDFAEFERLAGSGN
jgi:hypothetical protein